MDCKSVEKLISKFLKDECTPVEEAMVLEHIKNCPDCKEDLTIELLIQEGLNRLESGESFDLNAELEKRLEEKVHKKKERKRRISPEAEKVIWDIIGGVLVAILMIALLVWNR